MICSGFNSFLETYVPKDSKEPFQDEPWDCRGSDELLWKHPETLELRCHKIVSVPYTIAMFKTDCVLIINCAVCDIGRTGDVGRT